MVIGDERSIASTTTSSKTSFATDFKLTHYLICWDVEALARRTYTGSSARKGSPHP